MIVDVRKPDRLFALLRADDHALRCFDVVRQHGPKGAYIAAGFIRNRVWDQLYPERAPLADADIDVIYFDSDDVSRETEARFEALLCAAMIGERWQVRNQARMHEKAGYQPFAGINQAMMHWPETATAVAVRLNGNDQFDCIAPFGLVDLYDHILRITPAIRAHDPGVFAARQREKAWQKRWPWLHIIKP